MPISDPNHWIEEGFFKGPKYNKVLEIIAALNLNTTHAGSDGKDHSDVVLNNTHRVAPNPHSGHVDTSGDETIAGVKTFSSIPVLPATNPTLDDHAVRKVYVDSLGGDIWEDESISVDCAFEFATQTSAANKFSVMFSGAIANIASAVTSYLLYSFPLPTRIGSLRFYCTAVKIHLYDADGTNYIDVVEGIQMKGSSISPSTISSGNFSAPGEHNINVNAYLDAAYGEGTMYKILMTTQAPTNYALDVSGVTIVGYYT